MNGLWAIVSDTKTGLETFTRLEDNTEGTGVMDPRHRTGLV